MESQEGNIEHLPTVIEKDNIPSDRDEIPSPDLCRKFQHLSQIAGKIPDIREDVDVLLMIGRNCPEPLKAEARLRNLLRTLNRKTELMREYQAFLGKILDMKHATPVQIDEPTPANGTTWYLPHFPVRHPKKPDIRVVFDASSEFNGISLNQVLLQGPDQMDTLLGILLRFRVDKVAVMGDGEKMFHNFHVTPNHRNFLRILWFQDNNPEKAIVHHRMNVHLFGNISSPAVATFGIRRIARECESTHGKDMSEFIHRDFYVDDGLTSQPDTETAISLVLRTKDAIATVLATTLSRTAEAELQGRVAINETVFYSDSRVVLGRIANESKRFHVYVANRVHKIHAASKPCPWHHISSGQNPADLASRSVPAGRLNDTNWFRGPDFFWQSGPLPAGTTSANTEHTYDENDPEVRKQVSASATNVEGEANKLTLQGDTPHLGCACFSRFSSWPRLERAVGNLIRRIQTFKAGRDDTSETSRDEVQRVSSNLSSAQLQQAERAIFRAIQSESFSDEVRTLKKARTEPNSTISRKSPPSGLAPFLDDDGILRVGGRLKRGNFDLGVCHPIVLPKGDHVSRLLVEHLHREVRHQGRHLTTGAVSHAGLWILGLHKLVRGVINQCTTCRRLRGKPLNQIMGGLPGTDSRQHHPSPK
ncbi:uncharacterized protein LOC110982378 [Acanthaster planci]|uniref:Uncharacterized protein LOC110982378 n=1 Tax=Acanthaster planci TaxID=133434 RepID=A0A8B7YVC5_ACAPL|nr:uncharacterized protein LOC110982378 [Acanthaster planci]